MKSIYSLLLIGLLLVSCSDKASLQKYMVTKSEDPAFISVDLGSEVLSFSEELSDQEKKLAQSLKKFNFLAFVADSVNTDQYKTESQTVSDILKHSESYEMLMKFGHGKNAVNVYSMGEDNLVDEFVIFVKSPDNGFFITRILGDDMDTSELLNYLALIKKTKVNSEQMESALEMITKM